MPTKVALVALAVAATTIAGCQNGEADSAQPAAGSSASSAPAGNGVAALTGDEILKRAKAALTQAKSFRAKGAMAEDGQQTEIDLKVSGADFAATLSFDKAKVELLAVGGKKYLRPNAQFWAIATSAEQGKTLSQAMGGRWVAGADSDQSFGELFTVGSVDELLKPTGTLSKGEEKKIGGVPAIGLKDSGDPDSVLYVATTGEPYPLQMVAKAGSAMVFSAFGETFTDIKAPAADQIVDMGKLTGK